MWIARTILLFVNLASASTALAVASDIESIGEHYRFLTFEKNENPQNIMIMYTKLDGECHVVMQKDQPLVDVYWLMDGKRFKPTHRLIKSAIRKRIVLESRPAEAGAVSTFQVRPKEGTAFSDEVARSHFTVNARKIGGKCAVETFLGGEEVEPIRVNSLLSVSRKTVAPPFRKLVSVTVKGTEPGSTSAREKVFLAK